MLNTQYLIHVTAGDNAQYSVFRDSTPAIVDTTHYLVHDTTGNNAQYSVFGT